MNIELFDKWFDFFSSLSSGKRKGFKQSELPFEKEEMDEIDVLNIAMIILVKYHNGDIDAMIEIDRKRCFDDEDNLSNYDNWMISIYLKKKIQEHPMNKARIFETVDNIENEPMGKELIQEILDLYQGKFKV